jgi:CRISPR-associated protein Csb1
MTTLTKDILETWANDPAAPVALHLKQKLTSVECITPEDKCIIYPPTYADIGYNIDSVDGKKVALVDSVGSQANRMEPLFKSTSEKPEDWLVPQIQIALGSEKKKGKAKKGTDAASTEADDEPTNITTLSLLDLAHRGADAVVHSSGKLAELVRKAFAALREKGDASKLCAIAPTSLVFGVWDSRGASSEKRPRLVRSIIRAWDVEVLHAAAQFNSVWKELDDEDKDELQKESAKKGKPKLSVVGLADAPAVFRDTKASQYFEGAPNPEARVLGGVLVKGDIERTVTVNLVALRGLQAGDGPDGEQTKKMRTYLLSLALIAATGEMDLFLREGCHLRYKADDQWFSVPRRGDTERIELVPKVFKDAAEEGAKAFRQHWPAELNYTFNVTEAKKLLSKKEDEETAGGEQS